MNHRLATASLVALVLLFLLTSGCDRTPGGSSKPRLAVTSSYIESAVRDVVGDAVDIERLVEPGMCPGHFDVRPAQVRALSECAAMLRFDFQSSLDRQVESIESLRVVPLTATGGMCEPETYLAVCRQVGTALLQLGFLDETALASRLEALTDRLRHRLLPELQSEIAEAELAGVAVIASGHQSAFCSRLGLRVIATIGGSDNTSIRRIDDAVKLGEAENCRIVVANRPEGTQLASSLASRLGARLVVFDNFPAMTPQQPDFDAMVRQNVRALLNGGSR
jgi:ABC-type Zn uptake system ZnuABC Zn-binding protein ZnuA